MPPSHHSPTRRVAPLAVRLLAALAATLLAVLAFGPAGALADGTPNISLTNDAQDNVLYGAESTVRLTASNPAGSSGTAYNVSYRVVVPANVTYVAGSASTAGEPAVIANQPAAGQTTLLWKNIADLGPGSTDTIDFRLQHAVLSYVVGSVYTVNANVYAGTSDAYPPGFNAAGIADTTGPNAYTAYKLNQNDTTTIKAFEITKTVDTPSPTEILRGVHDQQAIYTVSLRNNTMAQTTHLVVEDYLPAGLEFIGGCGTVSTDNTTNAPSNPGTAQEYPGSGAIPVTPVAGCVAPNQVDTLTTDPAGPAPNALYTRVRWTTLGTIAAGATMTLKYRAAVPLRTNTLTWAGGVTPFTSGEQAANLNNNSGGEVLDGATITSYTHAQGDFNDTVFTQADGSVSRTVKDVIVQKAARAPATLQPGSANVWDLTVRTSEYRSAQNIVVTDTVPDGLCPLSSSSNFAQTPHDPSDLADCGTGADPSEPYATVQENPSGSYSVVWNGSSVPALAELGPNATQAISFSTRARQRYQEGFADAAPIVALDTVRNDVSVAATARVICNGRVICPAGPATGNEIYHSGGLSAALTDTASASIRAVGPVLTKRVADSSSNCSTATYTDGSPAPAYRPGDRICWLLRVDYPSGTSTSAATISDYLPNSLAFDATFGTGGEEPTGNDTAGAATVDASSATPGPGGAVQWTLASPTVGSGAVFEHRLGTRVALPAGAALGDLSTNLATTTVSTSNGTATLRDDAPYRLSMPVMSTQKRVIALDGVSVGGTAGVTTQVVRGGQDVTYRVRLSNAGDQPAERVEAWDPLPAGVTCADVAATGQPISDGGACNADTIKWGASPTLGPDVPPVANHDLTYTVRVPTTIQPTQALTSAAGIRAFQTPTNTGGTFVYIPSSNVDPTQNASANIVSPTSPATLTGAIPTISQTRTTAVVESSGGIDHNSADNATIGETIHYAVSTTVPAGVTVRDFEVSDTVLPRQTYLGGTLTQTAGPAASALSITGSTITFSMGASWTAPVGADTTFTFEFDTRVSDIATNYRSATNLSNLATMFYTPPGTASGGARTSTSTPSVQTEIVEPSLTLNKTADVGSTPVIGNDVVEYTLTLANITGITSPAHETTLVDTVPTDMTPLNAAGDPIANGESTLDGGVWNSAARTLTFSPSATIHPGTTETFTYRVRVNDPAVGGKQIVNSATATTTSLAGSATGERTIASPRTTGYTVSRTATIGVLTPSIATSVADANLTIGQRTQYTLDVTIPANTIVYDGLVREVLPDSLDFDGYVSHTCTAGCSPGPTTPTIQPYTPVSSGGSITLAWDLGDLLTQAPVARTFRLVFGAHLRATHRTGGSNVVRPQTSVDAARVQSNRTNKVGAFNAAVIPAGTYDDLSPIVTKTITAVEPAFSVDKRIAVGTAPTTYVDGPVLVRDGDTLNYRLIVTNTGNAPAHDVEITDVPNAELRNIAPATGTSTTWVTEAWSGAGDDIKWTIPGPIAPNATQTVEYTADLPPVTALKDGDHLDSTAHVSKGWGLPIATRTADSAFVFRSYTSPTDLARATFDSPTITVEKTTGAGSGPIYPESADAQVARSFPWRVRVTNTSSSETATALTVRDTLPKDWTFVPGTASFSPGGSVAPSVVTNAAGDQLTWTTSITLAPGASTVLSYDARPNLASSTSLGSGPGNEHVNTATATVRNGIGNAADETGAFTAAADTAKAVLRLPTLTIAKTPDGGAATAGTTVPFHLVVTNTSLWPASNVVVSDTFPTGAGGLTYTPGTATASPSTGFTETSGSATAGSWTIASLPSGQSVDITVPLRTNPAAPAGTTVTNTASVRSDELATAVTDNGTLTLTPSTDLVAAKSVSAGPVMAGGLITYALEATNNGPSNAQNVTFTDVLTNRVTYVSASAGCSRSGATVTCTSATPLAPGATRTATITVRVNTTTTTNADNTVNVTSSTADPDPSNNAATVLVPVGFGADLELTKTVSATRVPRTSTFSYTFAYKSNGPSNATSTQIVDTLPAGISYVSGPAGCSETAGTVTCTLGTLVDAGAGTRTIVVRADTVGVKTNSASISSPVNDGAPANNTGTATTTVVPATDLGIAKVGPPGVAAGADIPYVLTATNAGPDPATGVTITDTLPAGTTFKGGDAGCTAAGQTVTCAIGALASGASAVRHITVGAPVSLGGQAITNTATITGADGDPNAANDVASASTQIGPASDLSITQTAPETSPAGGQATFSIIAHNAGPSTATGVRVTSDLPDGVTVESVTSAQGTCAVQDRKITCDLGALPNGASADVTIVVRLLSDTAGRELTNTAKVTGDQPDPNGANESAGTTVSVVTPPPAQEPAAGGAAPAPQQPAAPAPTPGKKAQLSLTKTTSQVSRAGERLNYLITATNQGPDVAEGVRVTDTLTGDVTYRSAKSSGTECDFSKGTVSCPIGKLAVGESVRINVAVTPNKAGVLVNNAVLSSSTADPDLSDNRAVAKTTPTAAPTTLKLSAKASGKRLRGGQRVSYTVKVRNAGKPGKPAGRDAVGSPAIGVDVCNTIPGQLAFSSTKGGELKDARLCFHVKALGPGETKTFKFRARVMPRARRGSFTSKFTVAADNASRVAFGVRSLVITDGKVSSSQVGGFTG